jgi:hypothetical protein
MGVISCNAFMGCSSGNSNTTNAVAKNGAATNAGIVGQKYPQSVADEFLKACETSSSKSEFCACVFEKIQQQYTFEEFSVIESKMLAGQTPADFVEFSGKAKAACTK